jgi:hypothetical protein
MRPVCAIRGGVVPPALLSSPAVSAAPAERIEDPDPVPTGRKHYQKKYPFISRLHDPALGIAKSLLSNSILSRLIFFKAMNGVLQNRQQQSFLGFRARSPEGIEKLLRDIGVIYKRCEMFFFHVSSACSLHGHLKE